MEDTNDSFGAWKPYSYQICTGLWLRLDPLECFGKEIPATKKKSLSTPASFPFSFQRYEIGCVREPMVTLKSQFCLSLMSAGIEGECIMPHHGSLPSLTPYECLLMEDKLLKMPHLPSALRDISVIYQAAVHGVCCVSNETICLSAPMPFTAPVTTALLQVFISGSRNLQPC